MNLDEYLCIYQVLRDERCGDCVKNLNPDDPMSNLYCPRYFPTTRMFASAITVIDEDVRRNVIDHIKEMYRKERR